VEKTAKLELFCFLSHTRISSIS